MRNKMTRKIIPSVCFLFLLMPLTSFCQINLTIEIGSLRNNNGQVLLEFNDENENIIKELNKNITDNKCVLLIENIKPGKYAFKYFHDENNNKKLDTNWLGIPKEARKRQSSTGLVRLMKSASARLRDCTGPNPISSNSSTVMA